MIALRVTTTYKEGGQHEMGRVGSEHEIHSYICKELNGWMDRSLVSLDEVVSQLKNFGHYDECLIELKDKRQIHFRAILVD